MGSLAEAFAALAAVSVDGVQSYALEDTPGALSGVQLPPLVIVPEWGGAGAGAGLEPNIFAAGYGTVTVEAVHALLVCPVASGTGARGALPRIVAAADVVLAALAGDPDLGGTLVQPLACRVALGVVTWAGVDYHGALFRHTWQFRVTPEA